MQKPRKNQVKARFTPLRFGNADGAQNTASIARTPQFIEGGTARIVQYESRNEHGGKSIVQMYMLADLV